MSEQNKPKAIDVRISEIYDQLTSSERRLADVVIESQSNLASFTAGELADRARISKATAARFFKRLGYANYNEARVMNRQAEDWGSPLYELTGIGTKRLSQGDFGLHIAQDLQNLTRTAEMLDTDALAQAISMLTNAKRIWSLGFRNSMALATYARALLINIKPDVRLIPSAGMSFGEELAGMNKAEDTFLIFGFRRRPAQLRDVMEAIHDAGAPSILITDMTAGRTSQLATLTLRCHCRGHTMFDSYATPMSLINYICSGVSQSLGEESVERLTEIEALHSRLDQLGAPLIGKDNA
ncbi:MurR/RpiR family transcriptional regulator [Cohaesibacter marisflavi]|uniref:MurR/RpiR family transcriptional regulator n=1 Tax=Cohaesibacter marisflavi TaxID=655353 RepID=UPI0029C64326|nr:MurR/RpiR family transcriptional regulator [Cohaesibacter marisflavi]